MGLWFAIYDWACKKNKNRLYLMAMSSKKEKVLDAKDLSLDFEGPANDELENEEELSNEELAITA